MAPAMGEVSVSIIFFCGSCAAVRPTASGAGPVGARRLWRRLRELARRRGVDGRPRGRERDLERDREREREREREERRGLRRFRPPLFDGSVIVTFEATKRFVEELVDPSI
jgi:hypothetical protein